MHGSPQAITGALSRHGLATVDPRASGRIAAQAPFALRDRVKAWVDRGLPLVVATQPPLAARVGLALGLALPSGEGRQRLAFRVAAADVVTIASPLLLTSALAALPLAWGSALAALAATAAQHGIELHVFGSLAWQALSGLDYLRPDSDVDLWWAPRDPSMLATGLDILRRWQAASALRLDGEIDFAGHAVSWREWRLGAAQVIAKAIDGPSLYARAALLDRLAPAALDSGEHCVSASLRLHTRAIAV